MQHTTTASAATVPPSTLSQALTQKIRELLQRERWSQREFAKRLGVTQGAVSYLLAEKRRATVLDYYERLARVFGVSLSVLIADLEHRVGKERPMEGGAPHATASARSHERARRRARRRCVRRPRSSSAWKQSASAAQENSPPSSAEKAGTPSSSERSTSALASWRWRSTFRWTGYTCWKSAKSWLTARSTSCTSAADAS